jgi:hypothetical protein
LNHEVFMHLNQSRLYFNIKTMPKGEQARD